MAEIMARVRAELGDDAIIVSTHQDEGMVRVTAAVEYEARPAHRGGTVEPPRDGADMLHRALEYHGVPRGLAARLAATMDALHIDDAEMGLAAALDELVQFVPLPQAPQPSPLMLVGPPGGGKTTSVAKLAARAAFKGHAVHIVTTDTMRAGAIEQLASFADILGVGLDAAASPDKLVIALTPTDPASTGDAPSPPRLVLIDTASANPFDAGEMARLADLAASAAAELVAVLPAGTDAAEAAEAAAAFAEIGGGRLLITRLDATRRLGALIAASCLAGLAPGEAGVAPQIAHGLKILNPVAIARMAMRDPLAAGARRWPSEDDR